MAIMAQPLRTHGVLWLKCGQNERRFLQVAKPEVGQCNSRKKTAWNAPRMADPECDPNSMRWETLSQRRTSHIFTFLKTTNKPIHVVAVEEGLRSTRSRCALRYEGPA